MGWLNGGRGGLKKKEGDVFKKGAARRIKVQRLPRLQLPQGLDVGLLGGRGIPGRGIEGAFLQCGQAAWSWTDARNQGRFNSGPLLQKTGNGATGLSG